MSLRGHFGHAGQSEVSENGPNEFAMPQNPGIYTKISFLACSEPKLQVWPCYGNLSGHKWPLWPLRSFWGFWKWSQRISHATKPGNRHHVSSMLRTKVTSLAFFMVIWVAINGQKVPFWPLGLFWGVWKWSQWISHAPKSGDRHQNHVSSRLRPKVTSLAIVWSFEWP